LVPEEGAFELQGCLSDFTGLMLNQGKQQKKDEERKIVRTGAGAAQMKIEKTWWRGTGGGVRVA